MLSCLACQRPAQPEWRVALINAPKGSGTAHRQGRRHAHRHHPRTHPGIWEVIINRPKVRNAVDRPTAEALAAAFRTFEERSDLKVAILAGAEENFCAGADLKAISSGHGNRVEPDGDGPMGPTRIALSKPVIAAIEGFAVAGGLELALWCDLRICSSEATLGVFCRRFGVPLIDGGTIRLPRLIGQSRALDLILTGRPVHADEALHIGLVNRVCGVGEAVEAARALAVEISRFPQGCLQQDRASVYAQWDLSLEQALLAETQGGLKVLASGETAAGAGRFQAGAGRHGHFDDEPT